MLLVCSASFKKGQTGDATQGRMTASSLRKRGHEVDIILVSYFPLLFESESGTQLSTSDIALRVQRAEVVHLLPATQILARVFRGIGKRPILGSSIFWGGWERVKVAWRNSSSMMSGVRCVLRELKPIVRYGMDYRGIDIFLPNSQAEGERLLRCFRISRGATYFPVPNGFVAPSRERLASLARPPNVPSSDYIVVPGVFARRKNQHALIRALKGSEYQVVFLGGDASGLNAGFMDKCRNESTENMHFLGYVASTSDEYWAILKYARCACLPSDCETPGIAMIEAAYAGCRPVITKYGGTNEYYGFDAEYLDPCSDTDIKRAIDRGWRRGRLTEKQADWYARFSWDYCVEVTLQAYQLAVCREKK